MRTAKTPSSPRNLKKGDPEISFHAPASRFFICLAWRTWRLGGEKTTVIPDFATIAP
jgi:hypothetical protein